MYAIDKLQSEYNLRIDLTSYIGARVENVPDERGVDELCVCIPIARNHLKLKENKRVYSQMQMYKSRIPTKYGRTHYIKMAPTKALVDDLTKCGYKLPYTGNAMVSQRFIENIKNKYYNVQNKNNEAVTNTYGV